jgi:hypothetical protein
MDHPMLESDSCAAGVNTTVSTYERFKWPKLVPTLSPAQKSIADDLKQYWRMVLPQQYCLVEQFDYTYPLRHLPQSKGWWALELGAGNSGHLAFEPVGRQEDRCIELKESVAEVIQQRFPTVVTASRGCQKRIPYDDDYFDRVVVTRVLAHLPDLLAVIVEVDYGLALPAKRWRD